MSLVTRIWILQGTELESLCSYIWPTCVALTSVDWYARLYFRPTRALQISAALSGYFFFLEASPKRSCTNRVFLLPTSSVLEHLGRQFGQPGRVPGLTQMCWPENFRRLQLLHSLLAFPSRLATFSPRVVENTEERGPAFIYKACFPGYRYPDCQWTS